MAAIPAVGRRTALIALTSTLTATSGCVQDIRSILSRETPERISLSIAVVPADIDPVPVQLANRLRSNLEAIGVGTTVNLLSIEEFRLQVLINHNFDIAIARHPGG